MQLKRPYETMYDSSSHRKNNTHWSRSTCNDGWVTEWTRKRIFTKLIQKIRLIVDSKTTSGGNGSQKYLL